MKERLSQSSAINNSATVSDSDMSGKDSHVEQERIDRILNDLFFSSRNKLLSDGIEFDANQRLVTSRSMWMIIKFYILIV